MRELTFEEMDQVGGGDLLSDVAEFIIRWGLTKLLNYAWDCKEEYYGYWIECLGKYPVGPYNYMGSPS